MPDANQKQIRIMIVDDHVSVRTGLRLMLDSHPKMTVVADAGSGAEALAKAETRPDIILLDIDLNGESGLDFLAELAQKAGGRVLIYTGILDMEKHEQAVRLGAMGLLLKTKGEGELFKAIEKVHEGEPWLDRATIGKMMSERAGGGETGIDPEREKIATLTPREHEIINAICAGATKNKQIADVLFISEVTVRHHLTSIFDKLGVTDRLELIIYAYKHNLAELPGKH